MILGEVWPSYIFQLTCHGLEYRSAKVSLDRSLWGVAVRSDGPVLPKDNGWPITGDDIDDDESLKDKWINVKALIQSNTEDKKIIDDFIKPLEEINQKNIQK
ncbi:1816_t:CDS:2 [Scutellospora calospora]|uniref:1816_t:CDS:1 n=1 Tax=Scutellospora calospora TaxID=85575 RepID=A0ACA9JWF3_9GLOM|nr:1816_t:CDS:2 [Scutellospora calospora]